MPKYLFFVLVLLIGSCSKTQVYQLSDQNEDKHFLFTKIKEYKTKGFSYENPSLVVDGFLMNGANLQFIKKLNFKKCEIKEIHFLNPAGAKNMYGAVGENGIILITTRICMENEEPRVTDSLKKKVNNN